MPIHTLLQLANGLPANMPPASPQYFEFGSSTDQKAKEQLLKQSSEVTATFMKEARRRGGDTVTDLVMSDPTDSDNEEEIKLSSGADSAERYSDASFRLLAQGSAFK